jgi:hypothetical protein
MQLPWLLCITHALASTPQTDTCTCAQSHVRMFLIALEVLGGFLLVCLVVMGFEPRTLWFLGKPCFQEQELKTNLHAWLNKWAITQQLKAWVISVIRSEGVEDFLAEMVLEDYPRSPSYKRYKLRSGCLLIASLQRTGRLLPQTQLCCVLAEWLARYWTLWECLSK